MHMKLDAGRTYRYRVAAYNKTMKVDDKAVPDPNYMSGWATPDTATTLTGAAPDAIDHTASTGDVWVGVSPATVKIFLYWDPPADPMGDPVNAYKVQGRPVTNKDGEELATSDATLCPPATSGGTDYTCPWATIKDNIGRPSGKDINSFEVTARDVNANTRYDAYFTTKANWQYRIAAKNRALPAGRTFTGTADSPTEVVGVAVDRTSTTPADVNFLLAPASLRVKQSTDDEGRTGLTLSWNKSQTSQPDNPDAENAEPRDATHYRVEFSDSGPGDPGGYDWRLLETPNPDLTDATQNVQMKTDNAAVTHPIRTGETETNLDLAAGQTRHYRVFALSAAAAQIMSWPSNQRSGTTKYPDKPDAPTDLTALPGSHTSINLAWVAPDGGTPPDDDLDGSEEGPSVIVGYYIQYLDEGSSSWTHIKNKAGGNLITDAKGMPDTKYTDKGLSPGASREYRIAAVNMIRSTEQRSDWTDLVDGSTVPIPLPNEASGLVAEATGVGSIELSWLEQADQPMDAEVAEYVIEYSPDGKAGTFKMLATVNAKTMDMVHTIYTDTGLAPNTERHYRVFAKNAKGISDQPSNVAKAKTADAVAPAAPTGVTATANSDTMVTVNWTASADPDGAPVTGYKVMWKMSSATEYADADMAEVMADARMHQVTGLTASTEYTFKVTAKNAKGYSPASDEATATTQTVPSEPTNLMANATSATEVMVTWDAPADAGGSAITGYRVTYRVSGAADSTAMHMEVTGTSATISGLMADTTYNVWVLATNADGDGEYAHTTVMTQMAPVELMAPIITLANPVGSTSVGVDWTAVSGATSYVLYAVHLENGDITARDVPPGQTSFSISGLNVGEDYLIFVGVFAGAANYKLSDPERRTIE